MELKKQKKNNAIRAAALATLAVMVIAGISLADTTNTGRVTAKAAGNTLIITMPYTGGSANNNAWVNYQPCGGGAAANAFGTHSASPLTVNISGLNGNTCYSLSAAYNDAVVSGTNPQTLNISTTWDSTLLHNRNRFSSSTKWAATNGWGMPSTKYGQFTCDTCHIKSTNNIKRINAAVNAPNYPTGSFNGTGAVNFKATTTSPNDFGDDSDSHLSSTRVCEVCHSQNKYHNWSSTNNTGGDLTHNNNADCTAQCHPHSLGFMPAGGCTSCHGYPPVSVSTLATPQTGATNAGPTPSIGAHNAHAGVGGKGMLCNTCHNGYGSYSMPNGQINIGFVVNSTNWPAWNAASTNAGAFNGRSPLYGSYNFNTNSSGTTIYQNNASYENTCAVYCHGGNWAGQGSGGTNSTPSWIGANQAACGTCHGASTASPPAAWPAANSHPKHAGSYGIACSRCHPNNGDTNHVRGSVGWNLNVGDPNITGGSYRGTASGNTGTIAQGQSYGSCATLYCHSNANPLGGTATTSAPTWGTTLSCTACHRSNDTTTNMNLAGTPGTMSPRHVKHLATDQYNFTCDECHANTAAMNSSAALNGASAYTFHVNGNKDIKFEQFFGSANNVNNSGGSYNGTTKSCDSVYCHSTGSANAAPFAAPQQALSWNGGASNCSNCHGNVASSSAVNASGTPGGRHAKHIGNDRYNFTCDECHANTAAMNSSAALNGASAYTFHVNGNKDIEFERFFGSANNINNSGGSLNNTNKTCDSVYCHSRGLSGAFNAPLQQLSWNGGAANCYNCHGGSAVADGAGSINANVMSGRHAKHAGTDRYNFTCDECHADTAAMNSSAAVNYEKGAHVNGAVNVKFEQFFGSANNINNSLGSYNSTTSCNNIYCHSKGTATAPPFGSPLAALNWKNGTVTNCGSCHGNKAAANTVSANGPAGAHNKHIGSERNNFNCDVCHYDTVANGSANVLRSYAPHVNGAVNVKFTNAYPYGGANINMSGGNHTFGGGSCDTIYCHSRGKTTVSPFTAAINAVPNWSGGKSDCYTCHGNTETPQQINAAFNSGSYNGGKHVMHAMNSPWSAMNKPTYNITCDNCHAETVDNDSFSALNYPNKAHANGAVNVKFSTTLRFTNLDQSASNGIGAFSTQNGPTCTNIYCHSKGTRRFTSGGGNYTGLYVAAVNTPNWTGGIVECNGCHGDPGDPLKSGAPNYPNDPSGANAKANSHPKHIAAGFKCYDCHYNTTNGGANIINGVSHVSGSYNVARVVAGVNQISYTPGNMDTLSLGAPNAGTCSGTFGCHAQSTWGGPSKTCVSCHSGVLGDRRQITATNTDSYGVIGGGAGGANDTGDFIRPSRHVNDGSPNNQIVTKWDCIVCHMAGEPTSGGTNGNNHWPNVSGKNDVMLRNVDDLSSANGYRWNRFIALNGAAGNYSDTNYNGSSANQMHYDMDRFCLGCHDSNGASQIAVANGTENGSANALSMLTGASASSTTRWMISGSANINTTKTANLRPFNMRDRLLNYWASNTSGAVNLLTWRSGITAANAAGGANYGRVVDVKSQFNSQNLGGSNWASHHNLALYKKRYGTRNTTYFPNAIFTTVAIKGNNDASLNGKGETSGLHCADCHLNETDAHGARNSQFMLDTVAKSDGAANGHPVGDQTWNGSDWATVTTYAAVCFKCHSGTVYQSGGTTASRAQHGSGDSRPFSTMTSPMGVICFNCHGGFSDVTAGKNGNPSGGLGAIHGTNEMYNVANGTGAGNGPTRRYRFMSGSVFRFYKPTLTASTFTDPTTWSAAGTGGGCYTVSGNDQWSSGCSSHPAGKDNITIDFQKPLDW